MLWLRDAIDIEFMPMPMFLGGHEAGGRLSVRENSRFVVSMGGMGGWRRAVVCPNFAIIYGHDAF